MSLRQANSTFALLIKIADLSIFLFKMLSFNWQTVYERDANLNIGSLFVHVYICMYVYANCMTFLLFKKKKNNNCIIIPSRIQHDLTQTHVSLADV